MRVATVRRAAGPADPPSSRPRAGVLGGEVFAYRFDPALGEQRVQLPVALAGAVTPLTELHWAFYADDPVAVNAPYASLAVCVDVRFDDGTRLETGPGGVGAPALAPLDRYGFEVSATAQFDARWSMPEQWNADTVSLAAWAGRRIATVEAVLGAGPLRALAAAGDRVGRSARGFLEVRLVDRRQPDDPTPAERVDTRRGSHSGDRFSRGNTVPAVAWPHGFNLVIPATDAANPRWPYRPSLHDDEAGRRLEAVQFSHQPSPWIGDRGVLQLMPFAGEPRSDRHARRRWIRRGTEVARPHRFAAELDGGLQLEVTVSDHAAAFRVRSDDQGCRLGFVLDQLDDRGRLRMEHGDDGRVRLSGWVPEGDPHWGNAPRMYFSGASIEPVVDAETLHDAGRGRVAGALTAIGALEVRIATSFISIEQARHSLELEAPASTSFERLREDAHAAWNDLLGQVTVPTPPREECARRGLAHEQLLATLVGNLYRLHLYPSHAGENAGTADEQDWLFADVFAEARPHGESYTGAPVVPGRLAVNNGYWDTYRTAWPALHLLDPALAGELLDGQLEQYRQGGFMARWSAPGYVDSMVGTSSDQIFADAARWGVGGFPAVLAFESGWKNACEPSLHPYAGRKGIDRARFTGYVASEVREGMSWSLENAISDAGLARLAAQLGTQAAEARQEGPDACARYRAYARYFANRSRSYRQLFEPRSRFFRGRDERGAFAATALDPRVWGGDYVETNAWGMSVAPVHDGAGLAALYGGPAGLAAHLDRLFAEPETARPELGGSYGTVIHEQREARAQRSGMCALSNQPAHHIPFMYLHSDRPWQAAPLVHGLAGRLFAGGHIGQGYPGDEDNGEMSAWWLWAALGLYPLELGSGELRIGSPLLDDVTVRRHGGGTLRVRAHRATPGARFLSVAQLDGAPLERPVLAIDALTGDRELDLWFREDASHDAQIWRAAEVDVVPWHRDLSSRATTIASGGVTRPERAFDDGADDGASGVRLERGEWLGQALPVPARVTDMTLTALVPAEEDAFAVEWSHGGGTWYPAALSHAEPLLADRTTPFGIEAAGADGTTGSSPSVLAGCWRVRALAPLVLRQLEWFALHDVSVNRRA
ncbi:glycoside hydrolase domain-containing protein [Luethyella okanaganae]|uniref:Glycoside hydrolase domain-containing protein n=1 Tax=Luethyella okanaganae TaxID=69372 RepID=A0ABW1VE84_9MICO